MVYVNVESISQIRLNKPIFLGFEVGGQNKYPITQLKDHIPGFNTFKVIAGEHGLNYDHFQSHATKWYFKNVVQNIIAIVLI